MGRQAELRAPRERPGDKTTHGFLSPRPYNFYLWTFLQNKNILSYMMKALNFATTRYSVYNSQISSRSIAGKISTNRMQTPRSLTIIRSSPRYNPQNVDEPQVSPITKLPLLPPPRSRPCPFPSPTIPPFLPHRSSLPPPPQPKKQYLPN